MFIAIDQQLTGALAAGHVRPAQEHDARPAGRAPCSTHRRSSTSTSPCGPASASSRSPPSSRRSTASRWTRRTFYELRQVAAGELLADYPWLETILADAPKGASLEGFLWPATYRVLPDTTAEELVRLMLDGFYATSARTASTCPKERGLTSTRS